VAVYSGGSSKAFPALRDPIVALAAKGKRLNSATVIGLGFYTLTDSSFREIFEIRFEFPQVLIILGS